MCQWKGKRQEVVFSTVNRLREDVKGPFPDLGFKAFRLFVGNVELTQEEQVQGRGQNSGEVVIMEESGQRFIDESWTKQAQRVFLLVDARSKIVGTGVALTVNLAMCTLQYNPDLAVSAVFPGEDSIRPLNPPIWSMRLASVSLSLREFPEKVPLVGIIELDPAAKDYTGSGWVLYVIPIQCTRAKPVVQSAKFQLENYAEGLARPQELSSLGEGATGAPVFNSNKNLVGLYFADNGSICVLSQRKLAEQITQKPLDDRLKAHLPALLKNPMSPKAHTIANVFKHSETPTSVYTFNLATNSLLHCTNKGRIQASIELPVVLESGFSLLTTRRGLYITGLRFKQERFALVCRDGEIEKLTPMTFPHIHHVSVDYKGELVVLSGLNSHRMETLKEGNENWVQGVLEWMRAWACAVVCKESIYVFGGMGWNCRSWKRSILSYNGGNWSKAKFLIPKCFINAGALIENNTLIVFGGIEESGTARSTTQYINLSDGKHWEKEGDGLGCYGGLMPWKQGAKWLAVNSEGSVLAMETEGGRVEWLYRARGS